jgi:hypothetical protein
MAMKHDASYLSATVVGQSTTALRLLTQGHRKRGPLSDLAPTPPRSPRGDRRTPSAEGVDCGLGAGFDGGLHGGGRLVQAGAGQLDLGPGAWGLGLGLGGGVRQEGDRLLLGDVGRPEVGVGLGGDLRAGVDGAGGEFMTTAAVPVPPRATAIAVAAAMELMQNMRGGHGHHPQREQKGRTADPGCGPSLATQRRPRSFEPDARSALDIRRCSYSTRPL